jgi:hypothetical protein
MVGLCYRESEALVWLPVCLAGCFLHILREVLLATASAAAAALRACNAGRVSERGLARP